jgi:hypothetical protein
VYGAYNHAAGDLKMVYSTEMGADRVTYPANRVDTNPNNWTVGLLYEKFLDPYRTVQRFDMYMENWQGNQVRQPELGSPYLDKSLIRFS